MSFAIFPVIYFIMVLNISRIESPNEFFFILYIFVIGVPLLKHVFPIAFVFFFKMFIHFFIVIFFLKLFILFLVAIYLKSLNLRLVVMFEL